MVMIDSRSMRIVLSQCPAWHTQPPLALGIMTAIAKQIPDITVSVVDINQLFYKQILLKTEDSLLQTDFWSHENIERYWLDENFVKQVMLTYSDLINTYINTLIANSDKLITFTLYYTSKFFTYEVIRQIKVRAPHKIILCGGPLCFTTSEGKNILNSCAEIDGICYGEAESVFADILRSVRTEGVLPELPGLAIRRDHTIIDCGESQESFPMDSIPFADYSAVDVQQYVPRILPVYMSRSCINKCRYCNEKASWGKYRFRKPQRVVDDILYQKQAFSEYEYLFFTDSLLNASIEHLVELCAELNKREVNIYWGCQCMIRQEMTELVFQKMASAKCNSVTVGLESGSNNVLSLMGKHYSVRDAEAMFAAARVAGISIHANIIVGYPGESKWNFLETVYFACKMKMKFGVTFAVLICCISNGSYLHQHLDALGIVLPQDWLWHTKDNSNTISIRRSRQYFLSQCLNLVQGHSFGWGLLNNIARYLFKTECLDMVSPTPSGVLLSK